MPGTGIANKAFKYRIYPTKEQAEAICRTFGCCRKIWNLMLGDKVDFWASDRLPLEVTPAMYKDKYPYLKEVDSLALANVQLHLKRAYKDFFSGKAGFPQFKSRAKARRSYTTNNQNGTVDVKDGRIRLPKVGLVPVVIHRPVPEGWKLKSATVSQDSDGAFYCSLLYEHTMEAVSRKIDETKAIGLDYKSDGFYVDSSAGCVGSPKYFRKAQKRLAREQRKLSRKKGSRKGEEKSANWYKQQKRVNRIHCKAARQRKDFCHKKSHELAENYDIVCLEDMDLKAVSNKGFGNGKATLDNGFGMFRDFLEYKMADRGKTVVYVDRFYPSSQICSCCGHREKSVKDLRIRKWTCPSCHTEHDRDYNSAVNIRDEGLRIYRNRKELTA